MVDGILELRSDMFGLRMERSLTVHKMRGVDMLGGRHSMRITEAGMEVFPRLEAIAPVRRDHHAVSERISTGLPELDGMIGGGLRLGSNTLLVGPSGVGKTTLGLHFLSQCTPEEPGVMLGMYETPRNLAAKARTLDLPLTQMLVDGVVEMLWFPTTEGLVDEIGGRLIETVRRRKARRIFVDGIGGLQSLMHDPARLSRLLAALSVDFQELAATALFSAESGGGGGVHDLPLDGLSLHGVSAVAQNIFVLRYLELRNRLHRAISILKTRDGPLDPLMRRFQITNAGIDIDPDPLSIEKLISAAATERRQERGL
jgi:circadian clock protein KaiC